MDKRITNYGDWSGAQRRHSLAVVLRRFAGIGHGLMRIQSSSACARCQFNTVCAGVTSRNKWQAGFSTGGLASMEWIVLLGVGSQASSDRPRWRTWETYVEALTNWAAGWQTLPVFFAGPGFCLDGCRKTLGGNDSKESRSLIGSSLNLLSTKFFVTTQRCTSLSEIIKTLAKPSTQNRRRSNQC